MRNIAKLNGNGIGVSQRRWKLSSNIKVYTIHESILANLNLMILYIIYDAAINRTTVSSEWLVATSDGDG